MQNVEDIYPLSLTQKGILFHNVSSRNSSDIYMTQMVAELDGDINISAFKHAWQLVIDHHPIFRTAFEWEDFDDPLQIVYQHVALSTTSYEWTNFSPEEQATRLETFLKEDRNKGFSFSDPPLARLALIKMTDHKHLFIFTFHLLMLDGWSKGVVLKEVLQLYEKLSTGQHPQLTPSQPFKNYIKWSVEKDFSHAEHYWRKKLKGYKTSIHVSTNGAPPAAQPLHFQDDSIELEEKLLSGLGAFARQNRLTVNTIIQAAWALLLSHYSNKQDVVFGAAVSGRPPELTGSESIVGFTINTIPVRSTIVHHSTVRSWLKDLQEEQNELRNYENVPLAEIKKWSEVNSSSPFFESVLLFENWPGVEVLSLFRNMRLCPLVRTMYPLTLCVLPKDSRLTIYIAYEVSRFDGFPVRQILDDYKCIITSMLDDPENTIEHVSANISTKGIFKDAPSQQPVSHKSNREFIAPTTPTEETIVEICTQLLGIDRLSVEDNFFELGGHSLFAANLITQLSKIFSVELSLSQIFQTPTAKGLATTIDEQKVHQKEGKDGIISMPQITPNPDRRYEPFPLTDLQQGYWVGRRNSFGVGNVASKVLLEVAYSELDLEKLNRAWQLLIERHDMLRFIVTEDGQGKIVENVPPYKFEISDLSGKDQQTVERELKLLRDKIFYDNGSADRWPLFEVHASVLDGKRTRVLFCLDQLFVDAGSVVQLFNELYQLYENLNTQLTPLSITFCDYVLGEIAFKDSDTYKRSRDYWMERLDRIPPAPELPLLKTSGTTNNPQFVRRSTKLDPALWSKIKKRATEIGVTNSGMLITVFAQVLSLWSKSPRFTLNVPIFNRLPLHPEVNNVIGEFTSFILLEVDNSKPDNFVNRAKRLQKQLWDNYDHSHFNGVAILRELARVKGGTSDALMPVVFTSLIDLKYTDAVSELGDLTHWITKTAQVWLDHHVLEEDGALIVNWDCLDQLFPEGLLDNMFDAYDQLLSRLANDKAVWEESWLETVKQLLPSAQVELRNRINTTLAPIPEKLLHNLFEERVEEFNNKPAIITSKRTLTYRELDRLSNLWGGKLRKSGIQSNTLVAVVMEKGWEQVVSVLGILKSGAAYLPIDAKLPKERMWYLLDHGNVKVVLTQSSLDQTLEWPDGLQRFCVDSEEPTGVEEHPLDPVQRPEDLAYVIYTSGSTGLPKGVMIDHRGAVNTILDINQRFAVGHHDRVLALSSLSFDLSVYDIFGTLAAGATVIIPDHTETRDPSRWTQWIIDENVTIWNSVPALMELLVEYVANRPDLSLSSLRLVLMSGDWIPVTLPDQIKAQLGEMQIISLGGATEASIWSIIYPIETVDPHWKSIPYGRPMVNQQFHVLNEALAPCPVWVPGQLYIGGIGLAKGYWGDEEKTQASFITNTQTGERLYRTGDLGRYLPDGNIEFMGREDFQVKIQGYRVELEDIEAALAQHPEVRTVVVTAVGELQGDKRLVAYVVPEQESAPATSHLRHFLQEKLPEHMIPSAFIMLEQLPLTPNGKVDRKALPDQNQLSGEPLQQVPVETTDLTAHICQLVSSILKIDIIDPDTNLLSLGATSIDMIRIGNQLEKEYGIRPPIDQIFLQPTVRAIAEFCKDEKAPKSEDRSIISIPYEQGIDDEDIKTLLAGYELQIDPETRHAFRDSQPGLRPIKAQSPQIQLIKPIEDEAFIKEYRERRSHRTFSLKPISLDQFSKLLSCVSQIHLDGKPKYLYGSAGSLYPGQVYLHFKPGRVEGIKAGTYYYDPVEHRLIVLTEDVEIDSSIHVPFINVPIFDEAAFSIFLITDLNAIGPNYGKYSLYYSVVEAGIIAQLLEMTAPTCSIGLCQIGSLNFAKIRHLFKLQKSHVIVHSLLGGPIEMNLEESGESSDNGEQAEAQKMTRLLQKIKNLSKNETQSLLDANKTKTSK